MREENHCREAQRNENVCVCVHWAEIARVSAGGEKAIYLLGTAATWPGAVRAKLCLRTGRLPSRHISSFPPHHQHCFSSARRRLLLSSLFLFSHSHTHTHIYSLSLSGLTSRITVFSTRWGRHFWHLHGIARSVQSVLCASTENFQLLLTICLGIV